MDQATATNTGDKRTGDGDGDNGQIVMQLGKIPTALQKITVTVTFHAEQPR